MVLLFFLISEDSLRIGLGLAVYCGLVSFIVSVDGKNFFGCLLFWVFVGAMLVMFCMVVRIVPNPVFRLFSFVLIVTAYAVYVIVIEMLFFECDVFLGSIVMNAGASASEVVIGRLGSDCFSGL